MSELQLFRAPEHPKRDPKGQLEQLHDKHLAYQQVHQASEVSPLDLKQK
jgi:hypothetical protein